MPCYDYLCPKCKAYFELIIQHTVDGTLDPTENKECPTCGTLSPRQYSLPPGKKHHLKFLFNYMEPTES